MLFAVIHEKIVCPNPCWVCLAYPPTQGMCEKTNTLIFLSDV